MNDVRLFYVGSNDQNHHVALTQHDGESQVIVVTGVVVDDEQFDLVGLDRIVDEDTGIVSYNIGIWTDNPESPHEGDWRTIYTIDAEMVQRRLAARKALPGYDAGPFQPPAEPCASPLEALPVDWSLSLTRLDDGWGAKVIMPNGTSAVGVAGDADPNVAAAKAIERAMLLMGRS